MACRQHGDTVSRIGTRQDERAADAVVDLRYARDELVEIGGIPTSYVVTWYSSVSQ